MKTKLFAFIWIGLFLLISCAHANLSTPTPKRCFSLKLPRRRLWLQTSHSLRHPRLSTSTPTSLGTPTSPATPTLVPSTKVTSTSCLRNRPPRRDSRFFFATNTHGMMRQWMSNTPDNTQMTAGQSFVKTWKIKNSGTCTWSTGYTIIYAGYSTQMSGQPQPLPLPVTPGQEIQISVNFVAPAQAGSYLSAWTLDDGDGTAYSHFYGSNIPRHCACETSLCKNCCEVNKTLNKRS